MSSFKEGQNDIFFMAGDDLQPGRKSSPQLEGFRARGVEVLLLTDPVDSFWVTISPTFEDKSFASVTQGAADHLASIPLLGDAERPAPDTSLEVLAFLQFVKSVLADVVSDVKASNRLTESAVCLAAPSTGPTDSSSGCRARPAGSSRPPNRSWNQPDDKRIITVAKLGEDERSFKEDVAQLLYDEARVLDGDKPADAKAFSERPARLIARGLPNS